MTTATRPLQEGVVSEGARQETWRSRVRLGRYGLAILFVILAVLMFLLNRQNYLTVIFFLWLAFIAVKPVHGILVGYCALTL
ncbi:MAG TPA: hypothetical protein VKQ72_09745, partial [Aggregatilineales bacterium]|nr:hypothetical protein [Aggregatilineales bacterium]